jgi:hypothetical protein
MLLCIPAAAQASPRHAAGKPEMWPAPVTLAIVTRLRANRKL